jgi:hypothetical protein
MTKHRIREQDLYRPVHDFLTQRGYSVHGEVRGWDVSAAKGDELIAVELKRSINLSLVLQAVQRQRAADSVYVAVPRPPSRVYPRSRRWRKITHLLKRLELGLILVSFRLPAGDGSAAASVEIAFHPLPCQRKRDGRSRRAIIEEMEGRSGDFNVGGSAKGKIMTAYRESALFIACCLAERGPLSPKQLRAMGTDSKTQSILYNNHYGWFERRGRALYGLKPNAMAEIAEYPDLVEAYRRRIAEKPD